MVQDSIKGYNCIEGSTELINHGSVSRQQNAEIGLPCSLSSRTTGSTPEQGLGQGPWDSIPRKEGLK